MSEERSVRIEVPVAWGDMDAFGHVNNVVYLRWFESGRVVCFERVGIPDRTVSHGCAPILARTTCEFVHALTYPDTVEVVTTIGRIGTKSFTMLYTIHSRRHDCIAAKGDSVVVWYDYAQQRSVPLPADLRARLELLLETAPDPR